MNPFYYELINYVMWAVTALLIFVRYKNQRDYWYLLIGWSLVFPLDYISDKYSLFLRYNEGFTMLFDRYPLFLLPAFGWFFALPTILCLRFKNKIDALHLWRRVGILFVVFLALGFVAEIASTSSGYYAYYWPSTWMINGVVPLSIPITDSIYLVMLYFGHKVAIEYSVNKKWISGFLIHIGTYYVVFALGILITWLFVWALGIKPTW
ncbi:conserved membrane hypothetical protein [Candidatus Methanoperedens nitroreducens]|uniref:Uncharacterized protein n=1 Tax=Candidatus Methanoperedens nitratireducens TaxID=1392998 RepID=A0A284VN50_9EURY|nr:conserved membrane hypothetical protein [Candidatus Methanoperedens nitroreducens]